MLKVLLCVKQVASFLGQSENYYLNPYDVYTINRWTSLKKSFSNIMLFCLSMGPLSSKNMLKECIASGCDEAYLISDEKYIGSDTMATSYIIAETIKKLGQFDVIVCGDKSVDSETGFVAPSLAERLNYDYFDKIQNIHSFDSEYLTISQERENHIDLFLIKYPCLLSFDLTENILKNQSLKSIKKSFVYNIKTYNNFILDLPEEKCGYRGSKTRVLNSLPIQRSKKDSYLEKNIDSSIELLFSKLYLY